MPVCHDFDHTAKACKFRIPLPAFWCAPSLRTNRLGGRKRARRARFPRARRAGDAGGRPWRRSGPRQGRDFPASGSSALSRSPRSRHRKRGISRPAPGFPDRTAPASATISTLHPVFRTLRRSSMRRRRPQGLARPLLLGRKPERLGAEPPALLRRHRDPQRLPAQRAAVLARLADVLRRRPPRRFPGRRSLRRDFDPLQVESTGGAFFGRR